MKCVAAFWYESPGVVPHERAYPSVAAAIDDFNSMVTDWVRFGGAVPTGYILKDDGDEIIVELGPKGGVRFTHQ